MSNLRQRFREDTTGTLEFYPPEEAVPSAASVTLYRPDGSTEVQASDSGTVASASTTLSASASKGDRSVALTSATGTAAGQRFLLQEDGRTYQAETRSISGTTAYLVGALPFDVTSSATWKGWRCTYDLTADHTADRDANYQAHWDITIGGVHLYHVEPFDVVSALEWYPTRLADVLARYPRVAWLLDSHDLDGYEALRTTWEHMLIPSLSARGLAIERVRDTKHLVPLHVAFVNEWLAEHAAMIDPNLLATFDMARQRRLEVEAAVTSDVPWYDSDDDLAADGGEEHRVATSMEITR